MNQVFSLKRWLLLLRHHWTENSRLFFYGTLCLLGAIGIALLIWIISNHNYAQDSILNFYLFGLYIVGAILASDSFKMLQKKDRGIYYLSLPASHFEKLLTQIFYNAIFFTIVYSLCYYVMQGLATLFIENRVAADPGKYTYTPMDWTDPKEIMVAFPFFIYIYFGVQALFLLGSVYFKRFSFLLTTIVLVVLLFSIINYLNALTNVLFHGYYWTGGDGVYPSRYGGAKKLYRLPDILRFVLKWLMLLGWAPLLWLATCFRLKEKEI